MEKELSKAVLANISIPEDTAHIFAETAHRFEEMMMMYQCAIQEVTTKLEVLSREMSVRNNRNPIETIKFRIKKPKSIAEKLIRNGFEVSVDSASQNLNDVAGVRVICSFIEDIYTIAKMLTSQDDIHLVNVKDYIKNPKENGYRSYHMIIEIPVFFSDRKQYMRVEVQIRTMAMDFWASLEHKVRYKKDIPNSEEMALRLKKCADVIAATDAEMLKIAQEINII
ncbi:MAG: GTP pyrophosphokinase family protein [Clostridia bacterium]|nr:GTP pyrophosphokinase family protein [Clostridia bacterium]